MNRLIKGWPWMTMGLIAAVVFLMRMRESRQVLLDYDDGVHWQTAMAVGDGHALYREVFFAQPPLSGWLISLPFRVLPTSPAETVARLLMIAFALLLVAGAAGIAHSIAGRAAGLVAALLTVLLPNVQRYSFQFTTDLPAAALIASALWCALRGRLSSSRVAWAAAGVLVGVAANMKLIAVVILPALAVVVATAGARRWLANALWTVGGLAIGVALPLLVLRPPAAVWRQVFTFHLDATDARSPTAPDPLDAVAVWMFVFVVLATVATVLAIARTSRAQRSAVVAVAAWAGAFGPFAALYGPVFEHHLLVFVVPGTVMIAVAASNLWRSFVGSSGQTVHAAAVGLLAAACLLHAGLVAVSRPLRVSGIEACLSQMPDDTVLVTDDQQLAARAGLRTPAWLTDTSWVRIESGYLTPDEIIAAVGEAEAALLAPPERARIRDPRVLAFVDDTLPARFAADGYRLWAAEPALIAGCSP